MLVRVVHAEKGALICAYTAGGSESSIYIEEADCVWNWTLVERWVECRCLCHLGG
jgi:hypothetical protein